MGGWMRRLERVRFQSSSPVGGNVRSLKLSTREWMRGQLQGRIEAGFEVEAGSGAASGAVQAKIQEWALNADVEQGCSGEAGDEVDGSGAPVGFGGEVREEPVRGVGDGFVGEIEAEGEGREGGGSGELSGEKAAERCGGGDEQAEAEGEGGIGDDEAGGEIRAGIVEVAEPERTGDDGEACEGEQVSVLLEVMPPDGAEGAGESQRDSSDEAIETGVGRVVEDLHHE